jgi:hypothetical protein
VVIRHLTVLHGIFKRAHQVWDGLPPNPASAELVKRPRLHYDGGFQTLTPEQVRLLAKHATDDQAAALYLTAAFTGLRQGELFALQWKDIDLEVARVHVRRNYTGSPKRVKAPKSGKVRSAPLVDEVRVALNGLSQRDYLDGPEDLVFPGPAGGHLDDMAVRRAFVKALEAAGLPRIRFHDASPLLRHPGGPALGATAGARLLRARAHQHDDALRAPLPGRRGRGDPLGGAVRRPPPSAGTRVHELPPVEIRSAPRDQQGALVELNVPSPVPDHPATNASEHHAVVRAGIQGVIVLLRYRSMVGSHRLLASVTREQQQALRDTAMPLHRTHVQVDRFGQQHSVIVALRVENRVPRKVPNGDLSGVTGRN